jgi:hypothetical protein
MKRKPAEQQTKDISKKQKHIHFNMSNNIEYTNHTLSKEECQSLWYCVQEYHDFRAVALDSTKQIVRKEKLNRAPFSYQKVMELTYNACCEADSDFDYINDEQEQPCVLVSSDFVHLQRWLEAAACRYGLEKWSIRKIAEDKKSRRDELTDTVVKWYEKACRSL